MRRFATALAALAMLAMLAAAAPLVAHAADKPPPLTQDQRDRGKKEAPAAVQKAGIACTVTDAAYIGSSEGKDGKQDVYEVACQQGLGYVVLASKAATKAYDCVATATQPSLICRLAANADYKQGLKPVIAAAGVTCTPTAARYIGSNATTTVYEVACQEGPGFILQAPAPGVTAASLGIPCVQAPANMACTLTSKAQSDAYLAGLVAKSGRACQISGSRYMGTDAKSAVAYYEVGCGTEPGFVVGATKAGAFDHMLSCGQAARLAGGCTLTSATAIAGEQTGNYTRAAKAAGFDCDVSKSRDIGIDDRHNDVVEIACSNRADGVVLLLPSAPGAPVKLVDCIRATRFGPDGACKLTTPTAMYARYTAALRAKGRTSCEVSGARYSAKSSDGNDLVEVACSDGKPGYVLEFNAATQIAQAPLSCGQARAAGVECQLPTNAGH